MKLLKTTLVEINLDEERGRVKRLTGKKDGYTKAQTRRLLKLYDMFEQGKFKECLEFIHTWGEDPSMECSELEFVATEVWNVLWQMDLGVETVTKYQLTKNPCKICKEVKCIC